MVDFDDEKDALSVELPIEGRCVGLNVKAEATQRIFLMLFVVVVEITARLSAIDAIDSFI